MSDHQPVSTYEYFSCFFLIAKMRELHTTLKFVVLLWILLVYDLVCVNVIRNLCMLNVASALAYSEPKYGCHFSFLKKYASWDFWFLLNRCVRNVSLVDSCICLIVLSPYLYHVLEWKRNVFITLLSDFYTWKKKPKKQWKMK